MKEIGESECSLAIRSINGNLNNASQSKIRRAERKRGLSPSEANKRIKTKRGTRILSSSLLPPVSYCSSGGAPVRPCCSCCRVRSLAPNDYAPVLFLIGDQDIRWSRGSHRGYRRRRHCHPIGDDEVSPDRAAHRRVHTAPDASAFNRPGWGDSYTVAWHR